jgi:hypothetical protein
MDPQQPWRPTSPRHVLHSEKIHGIFAVIIVDHRDVGVIKLRESQGFAPETAACRFVSEHACGENLKRDVAVEALVVSAIHHTHAPAT